MPQELELVGRAEPQPEAAGPEEEKQEGGARGGEAAEGGERGGEDAEVPGEVLGGAHLFSRVYVCGFE